MSLRRREQAATTAVLDQQEEAVVFENENQVAPVSDPGVLPISTGWDAAKENRNRSDSKYPDRLKLNETPVLVKFLTSEPITWKQHFIKSLNKPFVCLKTDPRGCPLCNIGDIPKARYMLSVADLSGDEAVLKKLEFGPKLLDDLNAIHESPRGPLDRYCMRMSQRGTGFEINYMVDVVKDRDLQEEEGILPSDVMDAIDGMEALGAEAIYVSSYEDLAEIAESLV